MIKSNQKKVFQIPQVQRGQISQLLVRDGMISQSLAEEVSGLFTGILDAEKGQTIVRQGDRLEVCHVLLEGVAFRHLDNEVARQITTFLLAGDWPDVHGLFYPKIAYSVTALTACRFAVIDHLSLTTLMAQEPSVGRGLWLATLREGAIEREWLMNLGHRTDQERIAHLLCELVVRSQRVGLWQVGEYNLPVGSLELAQSTSCSLDNVKRILGTLEGMGLLTVQPDHIAISDFDGLKITGSFEASYLDVPVEPDWKA